MGRGRMPKSGISTAAVMTTVLQNWVEGEEKREEEDSKEVDQLIEQQVGLRGACLLYTSPSPRDLSTSRMPSSA